MRECLSSRNKVLCSILRAGDTGKAVILLIFSLLFEGLSFSVTQAGKELTGQSRCSPVAAQVQSSCSPGAAQGQFRCSPGLEPWTILLL